MTMIFHAVKLLYCYYVRKIYIGPYYEIQVHGCNLKASQHRQMLKNEKRKPKQIHY